MRKRAHAKSEGTKEFTELRDPLKHSWKRKTAFKYTNINCHRKEPLKQRVITPSERSLLSAANSLQIKELQRGRNRKVTSS